MPNNELRDRWNYLTTNAVNFGGWVPEYVSDQLNNYFDKNIDGKNIDLCCGFYPHVKGSIGVDISPLALKGVEIIGEREGREYLETIEYNFNDIENGSKLPFADSEFDCATMIAGWNYIKSIESLIEEVDRIVVPSGHFYVAQHLNGAAWKEDSFREDSAAKIVNQFRRLGYSMKVERASDVTNVVVVNLEKNQNDLEPSVVWVGKNKNILKQL